MSVTKLWLSIIPIHDIFNSPPIEGIHIVIFRYPELHFDQSKLHYRYIKLDSSNVIIDDYVTDVKMDFVSDI